MLIEHTSMSLVDFIDWLGTNLGGCCMHCVYFGVPPFSIFIQFALIKLYIYENVISFFFVNVFRLIF